MSNETTQEEDEKFIDHAKSYLQYCLDFCFSSHNCLLTYITLFVSYYIVKIKIAKMYKSFSRRIWLSSNAKIEFFHIMLLRQLYNLKEHIKAKKSKIYIFTNLMNKYSMKHEKDLLYS